MDKGGSDIPSPDPNIGKAALKQAQIGQQWLDFSKDAFKVSTARQGELDKLAKQVTDQQLGVAKQQFAWAKEDRGRWNEKFKPVEDAFIKEASTYGSPEKQAEAAAEAQADVSTSAAAARGTAQREAGSLGIKPGSGRQAGIDRAGELGTALAGAGAQNTARTAQRDKGLALKADVANMGKGLPAQAAASTQLGLGAGTSAYGIGNANTQTAMMPAQNMQTGYQGAMSGYAGQANTLTNLYNSQLQGWSAQQQANSNNTAGLFGAIGNFAGMAFAASDPKVKKNVKKVKKGEGLKAVNKMPVSKFDYKPGQGDSGRGHVGTMSNHFAKATGQQDTGVIHFQDAIGITMKAVQDLDAKVSKLEKSGQKAGGGKAKPKPRRASQSPAKARAAPPKTVKPAVKAQSYGIRR